MNIENIKYVFLDIDGVLSAPRYLNENNVFVNGFETNDWIQYNVTVDDSYKYCIAPKLVRVFVRACNTLGKRLFCLTAEDNSFSYYNKVDFVLKNYPEIKNERDILFTKSSSLKLDIIKYIAKRDSLSLSECLLVEDTFPTVIGAELNGVSVMHVSHLLNWEGLDVTTT